MSGFHPKRTLERRQDGAKLQSMQAPNRYGLTIRGDADTLRKVRPDRWVQINYLLNRLLTGERVAESEFEYYGMKVEVRDDSR